MKRYGQSSFSVFITQLFDNISNYILKNYCFNKRIEEYMII